MSAPKISKDLVSVGTDVEVFLYDTVQDKFKSAVGLIGGSKGFPRDIGNGCGIEEDGVSPEFSMSPVALYGGADALWESLQYCREKLKEIIPAGYEIRTVATAEFDDKELSSFEARQSGCSPEHNAFKQAEIMEKPELEATNLRTASGHIHVGFWERDFETQLLLVKVIDLFISVPGVQIDEDRERRKLYGRSGSLRFPPYGVEVRSPSNFWTKEKYLVDWVFNQIHAAIDFINAGKELTPEDENDIQECINNYDVEKSILLCHKFSLSLPEKVEDGEEIHIKGSAAINA